MTAADPPATNVHKSVGSILLFLAVAFLISDVILLLVSNTPYSLLIAIASLVFGLIGFSQLEKANEPEPIVPVMFELELLGAVLKTGTGFHVLVEITFSPAPGPPQALERIRVRLQRALNMYVSKIEAISNDPFAEFDGVLQSAVSPLCKELRLDSISLQTIDVKVEGSPQPPARGIYIGERPSNAR